MTRIGILSDTHGFLDERIFSYFEPCQEIWHAGDFGGGVAKPLMDFRKTRGVYGNIDGAPVRDLFGQHAFFECEQVKVMITHIGGYPGHYAPGIWPLLQEHRPDVFVCGHSHILKVMRDKQLGNLLHLNPGACGRSGFHEMRTILRLAIDGKSISQLEVVELGKRAS